MSVKIVNVEISMPSSRGGGGAITPPVIPPEPPEPIKDYVYRTDGLTKYYQFSEPIVIPANTDCSISLTMNGSSDTYEGLFRSGDGSDWFRLIPSSQGNNFQGNLAGAVVSGVPYSSLIVRNGQDRAFTLRRLDGLFYIDIDGQTFTLSVSSGEFLINVLCEFGGGEFAGYIKDFQVEIDGVITNQIPLTNKDQGDTQLPTVGDVSATIINYTDTWEEV